MLNLKEARILRLAIMVSNQLKRANAHCEGCDNEGSYFCTDGACEQQGLQCTLSAMLKELFITNPFLFEHNNEIGMSDFMLSTYKQTIKNIEEYEKRQH